LAAFDAEASLAFNAALAAFGSRRKRILELARQRHIEGHHRYGDTHLFEFDADRLAKERDEELADSVLYEMQRRRLG